MSKPLVAIDDGHGPETPGKRAPDGSLRENSFNDAVAHAFAEELTALGLTWMFVAPESADVSLMKRAARAVKAGVKVMVSIHANAGGGHGIETFYRDGDAGGQRLARLIQEETTAATGMPNHGFPGYYPDTRSAVKRLGILREPARHGIAAALWEGGYMDSADLAKLKDAAYRRTCAKALAVAVYRHVFGKRPGE
jgi:N-acetylmuramoyl-L-alanine amidase